jgi:hypothetical protein
MRLRRGERNKETPGDADAITAPAVAVLSDETDPHRSAPLGSVLGLSNATGDSSTEPINEWGLYDPDLAGFRALMSTLDTSEIPIPGEIEEDPSDLLLRQHAGTAAAATEVFEPDSPFGAEGAPRPPSAASAVASCRVGHLAPLSLWARLAEGDTPAPRPDQVSRMLAQWIPKAASSRSSPFASSDLAAKIGRLTHPAHVAITSLSSVCRIRGIRTAPAAVIIEPPDEHPGWPQPSVVPLPEAVTVEALQNAAAEPVEMAEVLPTPVPAESQLPPVPDVAEPPVADDPRQPFEFVGAQPENDADALADFGVAAVVPPALDALPIDFMTAVLPGDDVASFETFSFERQPVPPIEFDLVAAVPPVADAEPFGAVPETVADVAPGLELPSFDVLEQPAASDAPLAGPLADEPISVVPACVTEEPVREERPDDLLPVALSGAAPEMPVAVVEDPPPAIPVVPAIPPQAAATPARKRRRSAVALG